MVLRHNKYGVKMINYKDKSYVCHLDLAMDMLRGKWKAVILCKLNKGPTRFLKLQRYTKGISQKVLNDTLKQLENDGLISKTIFPEVPPRVEFELTQLGKELYPALEIIENWAKEHFSELECSDK